MLDLGVPGTGVLPTRPCAGVDNISREPEHRVNARGPLDVLGRSAAGRFILR